MQISYHSPADIPGLGTPTALFPLPLMLLPMFMRLTGLACLLTSSFWYSSWTLSLSTPQHHHIPLSLCLPCHSFLVPNSIKLLSHQFNQKSCIFLSQRNTKHTLGWHAVIYHDHLLKGKKWTVLAYLLNKQVSTLQRKHPASLEFLVNTQNEEAKNYLWHKVEQPPSCCKQPMLISLWCCKLTLRIRVVTGSLTAFPIPAC